MNISELLNIHPYSLAKEDKEKLLSTALNSLTRHHYNNCELYKVMMEGIGFNYNKEYHINNLPFLPVRLFKMYDLYSVPKEEVVKTLTSSGTTGQAVSRIFLDKDTAANQIKVLSKITSSFIGKQRLPMIIIDTESVIKNRNLFSARGAGILGFSIFGNKRMYALNDKMELNYEDLFAFIKENKSSPILLFGFTYIIHQHFYKELVEKKIVLDLKNAILFHGGGWKKLISESVSLQAFKENLNHTCGIQKIHEYYGMAEQTGSIFMSCEYGHLHASVFSEVIVRRAHDFSIADTNEKGIIQVLSILPQSYPGHSLLTEDEGILLGEDNCPCGRLGKYFKVTGRLKNAEIRGCSDTYAEKY